MYLITYFHGGAKRPPRTTSLIHAAEAAAEAAAAAAPATAPAAEAFVSELQDFDPKSKFCPGASFT